MKKIFLTLFVIIISMHCAEDGSGDNGASSGNSQSQADFSMPHGVVLSDDNSFLFVSDRGNGTVYKLDANTGDLLSSHNLEDSFLTGIAYYESETNGMIYVCAQNSDKVYILDADDLSILQIINVESGSISMIGDDGMDMGDDGGDGMDMGDDGSDDGMDMSNMDTPHYIVIDKINGYWFNSNVMSGYISQYSLETNELLNELFVDNMPALLTIDPANNHLYVSRMMPMNMGGMTMETDSKMIDQIEYSESGLSIVNQFMVELNPHAIDISADGQNVYTISNTNDFIFDIDVNTTDISSTAISELYNDNSAIESKYFKTIECVSGLNNQLFITCQGGIHINSSGEEDAAIKSQVQLWDMDTNSQLDIYEFEVDAMAWHIAIDTSSEKVFVSLSGKSQVRCLSYSGNQFSLEW